MAANSDIKKLSIEQILENPNIPDEMRLRFELLSPAFPPEKYKKKPKPVSTRIDPTIPQLGALRVANPTKSEEPNYVSGVDYTSLIKKVNDKAKITQDDFIELEGNYSSNKLDIPTFNIKNKITPRNDIFINFILKITTYVKNPINAKGSGSRSKLFTSQRIYDYLIEAYNRNIPYAAFGKIVDIVEVDIRPLFDKVKSFKKEEEAVNVSIKNNLGIQIDNTRNEYTIDYDIFMKYINWIVSKPSTNYDERLISVEDISDVVIEVDLDADESTETATSQSLGSSSSTESNEESTQPAYEPVGRPGTSIGESVTVNGMEFEWNGTSWEPAELGNPSGGTPPQGGSGNQGGSGGSNNQGDGGGGIGYFGGFS